MKIDKFHFLKEALVVQTGTEALKCTSPADLTLGMREFVVGRSSDVLLANEVPIINSEMSQQDLLFLARRRMQVVIPSDEQSEDFCKYADGLDYVYFSALHYFKKGFIDIAMVQKLQRGATLLSVGVGQAHLERLLSQGFGIQRIVATDNIIHPKLRDSVLDYYEFDMFQNWPDFVEFFDYIIFPESLGVALSKFESKYDQFFSSRFLDCLEEVTRKVLEGKLDEVPIKDKVLFMAVVEKDVRRVFYQYNVLVKAIKFLKPNGEIRVQFGITHEQQEAYLILKLKSEYPHLTFPPSQDVNQFIIRA